MHGTRVAGESEETVRIVFAGVVKKEKESESERESKKKAHYEARNSHH